MNRKITLFALPGKRGGLRSQRIGRTVGCPAAFLAQQLGQRNRTQPDAALLQKPAAADGPGSRLVGVLAVHRIGPCVSPRRYSFVIVSSKFRSTRATAVQPASSSTVVPVRQATEPSCRSIDGERQRTRCVRAKVLCFFLEERQQGGGLIRASAGATGSGGKRTSVVRCSSRPPFQTILQCQCPRTFEEQRLV